MDEGTRASSDAGGALIAEAKCVLRAVTQNANPANALSQLRAANYDIGLIHSHIEQLALMGNSPLNDGEFALFLHACKIYGFAKDVTDMIEEHKEIIAKPPAFPNILDY